MKRARKDSKVISGSQAVLACQALALIENGLQQIVFPTGEQEETHHRGHFTSQNCMEAREQLVRASTLVEVLTTFPQEPSDDMELTSAVLEGMLVSAKKVINLLLLLPQVQLQYRAPAPAATSKAVNAIGHLPCMVSPEDINEDAASKGDGAGVGTVEEEEEAEEETSVRFRHIVGNISAKQALHENIVLPLTLPPVLRQQLLTGIRTGCGNVLLHGPPGTGKTMLVEAAANEAGAALLRIRPSSILSKFHGESERSLQRIFASLAAAKGPTLLFIDEFDSFACSRGNGEGGEGGQGRRLLAELLLQLTALKHARRSGGQMVVVAATNRIEDIDPAAIRRFETRVYVGTPSSAVERIHLVQGFLRPGNVLHALQMHDLKEIAQWTEGWSGSDIESMCREAAMAPVRRAFPLGAQVPWPQASAEDDETGWPSDDEEAYVEEHLLLAGAGAGVGAGAGAGAGVGAGQMVTLGDFREAYLRATEFMDVHSDGDGGHI